MDHIAHLRNQFKSVNTFVRSYDYIYYKTGLVVQEMKIFKFRECTFAILLLPLDLKRCGLSFWTNLNPLNPKLLFTKFGWYLPSGSIEDILKFSMHFRYFVIISPWKRAGPFIWTNQNPLHLKMNCAKFGWNWPSGSGEEDILNLSMYLRNFIIISPWKRAGPFIWTKLESPSTKYDLC